jgi:PAS domain S-box-containing protein
LEAVADLGRQALSGVDTKALMDRAVLHVADVLKLKPSDVPELLALAGGPATLRDFRPSAPYHMSSTGKGRRWKGVYSQADVPFLQAIANILVAATRREAEVGNLKDSRDRLAAVLQEAGDGILVQDVQGSAVYMNAAFGRLAGLSGLAGAAAKDPLAAFEAEDTSGNALCVSDLPEQAAREGRRGPSVVAKSTDGRNEVWVQYQASPIFGRGGRVTHTVTTATDVTKAKHSEEAWRFLADATRTLAATMDHRQALERMAALAVPFLADYCLVDTLEPSGAVKRQVIAKTDEAATGLRRLEGFRAAPASSHLVMRALLSGTPHLHTTVSLAGGTEYAYGDHDLALIRELGISSAMVVPFAGRGIAGAVTFVSSERTRKYSETDLTLARELVRSCAMAVDNARLFQQAQEQQEALRAVLDSMTEGVLAVDLDMRIKQANAYASALLTRGGDRPEGKLCRDVLSLRQEDNGEPVDLAGLVGDCLTQGQALTLDALELENAQGAALPISLTVAPQRSFGKQSTGAVVLFRDMTRSRELDELRDRIISLLTHDLKTPLTHIKGYASSLVQADVQWEPDVQHEFLKTINREADRLSGLVNGILEVARAQQSLPLDLQRVPPAAVIERAVQAATTQLLERPTVVDIEEGLPEAAADPAQIERVLGNLLDNACKYSPGRTPVTIGARRQGSDVVFWVQDRGPGVAVGPQGSLFHGFARQSPEGPHGSGLGLSLCKAVVKAHGGRMWVSSEPGEGATFFFSLPTWPEPPRVSGSIREVAVER